MNSFYLLDYLQNNQPEINNEIQLLKYELDHRIYCYGDHFQYPKEKRLIWSNLLFVKLKYFLKNIYLLSLLIGKSKDLDNKTIVSNAYFSLNDRLADLDLNILRPIHNPVINKKTIGNFKIFREFIWIDKKMRRADFKELLSHSFLKKLNLFIENLAQYYKSMNVSALIVPNDISFFEQLNIKAFKKIGKPSFIFLHGLPGRYNIYDDNQTDYLVVWSEKIKQHYVKIGFKSDKILVSGHPYYESLPVSFLRNNLDNILIISKSFNGSQYRDRVRLTDRGSLIVYLSQVQKILESQGVKQVRLRVHPSENIMWYFKFIDQDFFIEDKESLRNSLEKSTLVIGPTSTVFLESIYYGVNYLVYEPTVNGLDLSGYPLVPPFDKSDSKALVANNEAELEKFIIEKNLVDKTIFNDYIKTPFDANCIIDKINLFN